MIFPSESDLENIRREYPTGCRVELVSMNDPYRAMPQGLCGTVTGVDDIGTVLVDWDDGSTLGVVYGVDRCKKI